MIQRESDYNDQGVPPSRGSDSTIQNDGLGHAGASSRPLRQQKEQAKSRGKTPFPVMLHKMLEQAEAENYDDIVSWQPHGRAFHIHDKNRFMKDVMPRYFRNQSQFSSFQRQLNLYGFLRLTRKGPDEGAYCHESLLRGHPALAANMIRSRINGNEVRQSPSPQTEPDFYKMSPLEAKSGTPSKQLDSSSHSVLSEDEYSARSAQIQDGDRKPAAVSGARPSIALREPSVNLELSGDGNLDYSCSSLCVASDDEGLSDPKDYAPSARADLNQSGSVADLTESGSAEIGVGVWPSSPDVLCAQVGEGISRQFAYSGRAAVVPSSLAAATRQETTHHHPGRAHFRQQLERRKRSRQAAEIETSSSGDRYPSMDDGTEEISDMARFLKDVDLESDMDGSS